MKSNICPTSLLLNSWLFKPGDGKKDEESDSKKVTNKSKGSSYECSDNSHQCCDVPWFWEHTIQEKEVFVFVESLYILYSLVQAYQHQISQGLHTRLCLHILGVVWNVTGLKTFPLSSLFLTPQCRQRHLQLSLHSTVIFETKAFCVVSHTGSCFAMHPPTPWVHFFHTVFQWLCTKPVSYLYCLTRRKHLRNKAFELQINTIKHSSCLQESSHL